MTKGRKGRGGTRARSASTRRAGARRPVKRSAKSTSAKPLPRKTQTPARKSPPSSSGVKRAASKPAAAPGKRAPATTKAATPRPACRPARRRAPAKRTSRLPRRLAFLALSAGGTAGLVALAGAGVLFLYGRDLPSVDALHAPPGASRIVVLDRDGELLGVHGRDQGPPVDPARLPPHVVHAFLATEDRNFYSHVGVNPVAVLRAAIVNARSGGVAQGGSTITQQLVKNALLTPERSVRRKAQEAMLALRIERALTKDEILGLYLNTVYFGGGAYGLESAARRYFGAAPDELSVGQAAMLAGLLKAPSRYAPTADLNAARGRASVVLHAMVDAGYLTAGQAERIAADGIAAPAPRGGAGGWAVDAAAAEARRRRPSAVGELVVVTTIDAALTETAQRALATRMGDDPTLAGAQAALVLAEEDGAIRVVIGGRDRGAIGFNRATTARRAPGSTFKPFVYLAAIEAGWRPESLIDDAPLDIDGYAPRNYKDRYYGEVTLTEALSRSLNAGALRLQEEVGRGGVVSAARRAGLANTEDVGPALGLGVQEVTPVELAGAYASLSRNRPTTPRLIARIEDPSGRVLYRHEARAAQTLFAPDDLVALDHMLRAVVREGSGVHAGVPDHQAAGKTGTGQDSRDVWFAGYASGLVGVVWMGHDDFAPLEDGTAAASGSGAPARVFGDVMTAGLQGRTPREPVPYVPAPDERSLFDHLADLLTRRRGEGSSPDELDALIEDVAG